MISEDPTLEEALAELRKCKRRPKLKCEWTPEADEFLRQYLGLKDLE
jgi:hypothetical protein